MPQALTMKLDSAAAKMLKLQLINYLTVALGHT